MSKNREKSSFQADMTLLTLVVLLTVLGLVILFRAHSGGQNPPTSVFGWIWNCSRPVTHRPGSGARTVG